MIELVRSLQEPIEGKIDPLSTLDELRSMLPTRSGIYRFIDNNGSVLYVGKSRNLKNRVTSYFRPKGLSTKVMKLVARTVEIRYIITASETEALLLEQSLIKNDKPPYNVILRDDKSYPYIHLTNHEFPQIRLHRGKREKGGTYFGPYPNAAAVRSSLSILQKIFQLRPCKDSYFNNRSRPCLEYQIRRCSAPCVGYMDRDTYEEELRLAKLFLNGKNQSIFADLKEKMVLASQELDFEKAIRLRDQIQDLRQVQEEQNVHKSSGDVDAFAIATQADYVCVQALFIRKGQLLGHRSWFPGNELGLKDSELLEELITQYYFGSSDREIPQTILTMTHIDGAQLLSKALTDRSGRNVEVTSQVRTQRARWQQLVQENAQHSLATHVASKQSQMDRALQLKRLLQLEEIPQCIECFDVSHSHGEATMASCVVFDQTGPVKSDYRRFKIDAVKHGDDYGALVQAIQRRYRRVQEEGSSLPDVLIIDGGKGQLNMVYDEISSLVEKGLILLAISKGPGRKPGLESIWQHGKGQLKIEATSGVMHLLQQIRDEAHRFAITGHRAARKRARSHSELDNIPGIGPKRKKLLLTHFGSTATIRGASAVEISKVPGISDKLAGEIYGIFHAS